MTKNDEIIERINTLGTSALTTLELFTMLLGEKQAAILKEKTGNDLRKIASSYPSDISAVPGLTKNGAAKISALFELARRKQIQQVTPRQILHSSSCIAKFISALISETKHEVFVCIYLNRSNKMQSYKVISMGGITGTVADPKIILKEALNCGAVNIVLAHNHPSGSLKPSRADEDLTRKIKQAAALMDMTVLDHVIVSEEGYYSFADEGLI